MLNNFSLVSSILFEPWFIETGYAASVLPALINMIEGKSQLTNLQTHEKQLPSLLGNDYSPIRLSTSGDTSFESSIGAAPSGSAAVIPIRGAITKYEGMCNYGVENYMQWIGAAEQASSVSEIVLLIDSPGGQANCAFMLAQRISQIKKPTLAYVDSGNATSAAYLIASAANKIYVNTPVDMVGSIGALIALSTFRSTLQGTKTWEIYSRLSTEKNLAFRQLIENDDPTLLQDMLDETVVHFIDAVKANRGDRLKLESGDPFKGATYKADKALKMGLIDGIAPLHEALASIRQTQSPGLIQAVSLQSTETPVQSNTHTQTVNQTMNFREKLAAWIANTPDETPDASATAETPQAPETPTENPIEARLAALEGELSTLKTQNQQLSTENQQLKSSKPAAEATTVTVAKEQPPKPVEVDANQGSFLSETDEYIASLKKGVA